MKIVLDQRDVPPHLAHFFRPARGCGACYICHMVEVFRAVRRVLRKDGCLFVNLGDSYSAGTSAGRKAPKTGVQNGNWERSGEIGDRRTNDPSIPAKNLMLVPDAFRLAMRRDGWYVRSKLPWLKRSCMPESVDGSHYARHRIKGVDCPGCPKCEANGGLVLSMSAGRPTSAVEDVILFTKSGTYFWDAEAVKRGFTTPNGMGWAKQTHTQDTMKTDGDFRVPKSRKGLGMTCMTNEGASGRHYRTSDMFFDSLGPLLGAADEPEPTPKRRSTTRGTQAWSAATPDRNGRPQRDSPGGWTAEVNAGPPFPPQGLILDEDGDPLALDVNPAGFDGWTRTERRVRVSPDDADDDTTRITTSDCPVHAGLPDSVPTASDGGRKAASPSPRSPGTDARLAPMPLFDSAPTDQPYGVDSPGESSGSPHPLSSPSATDRSNGTHKTGRDPATSLACMPSAQNPARTGDTSASPVASDSVDRTPESSSEPVGSADRPSAQTTSRTADTSSCTCSFFKTVTESISHFATFPPKLVRPLILAGTSEKGCCRNCGSPWVRVVERTDEPRADFKGSRFDAGKTGARDGGDRTQAGGRYRSTTTGWLPSCQCPDPGPPVPCTLLDPFAGSGTALMEADRLGRDAVGIDLQPDYVTMQTERLATDQGPLFANVEVVT